MANLKLKPVKPQKKSSFAASRKGLNHKTLSTSAVKR